jgi:putative ATP-dependent endonuclease of OLD family
MIDVLAKSIKYDLRDFGISLISVEGLNFDSFLPLFGKTALKIQVSIVTDADPQKIAIPGGDAVAHYPALNEAVTVSDNTKAMLALEDDFVKVFHGVKTFEYDLALHENNRKVMLAALKEIHPKIGTALEIVVAGHSDDASRAKALFTGLFERNESNVQKGRFAQALAAKIQDENWDVTVPDYIVKAIKHACEQSK